MDEEHKARQHEHEHLEHEDGLGVDALSVVSHAEISGLVRARPEVSVQGSGSTSRTWLAGTVGTTVRRRYHFRGIKSVSAERQVQVLVLAVGERSEELYTSSAEPEDVRSAAQALLGAGLGVCCEEKSVKFAVLKDVVQLLQ